ncbi:MAG: hypothetical protein GXY81_04190 [Candidatus Cloacimonetes bacterium]|nr:hypothetical protein [Candidatus Cloacimonadota bacterium]
MKNQNDKVRTSKSSPEPKPFTVEYDPSLAKAGKGIELDKLVALVKKVFLRLGIDGYRVERDRDGCHRLQIDGVHVNTGRVCRNRHISLGWLGHGCAFQARIEDCGAVWRLHLALLSPGEGGEAS